MNRISQRFQELAGRNETAFIPFITAGDPDIERTVELVLALERAGADVIELGVPFSDPVAEGPVIQAACQRALEHNVSLRDIFACIKTLREKTQVPLLLMTYYNPVLAYGVERFAESAAAAGVDGVITVDLPPEEADEYKTALDGREIATIFLVAPTSPPDRIERIAKMSTGFVYYVSRTGVTGERQKLESSVKGMVAKIQEHTDCPVCVGFGISTPEQAAEVAGFADGVIVGSAIVRLVGDVGKNADGPAKIEQFVKSLVNAAKGGNAQS